MNSRQPFAPSLSPSAAPAAAQGRLRRTRRRNRRGVAIVLVLGFIAVSLGLAYALLRAQASSVQLEGNYDRMAMAHQAAISGALAGIRKMHAADWGGVSSTLAGNITADSGYSVTFVTGDDSLNSGDADYDWWPYRVTIKSSGYARDHTDSLAIATSEVEVVVQLIPEKLTAEPAIWSVARQYALFHAQTDFADVDLLIQVNGSARFQSPLYLAKDAPNTDNAREQYLRDLKKMNDAGRGDYRQFTQNVRLPSSDQSGTANALETLPYQGLSAINTAKESTTSMPAVGTYSSYTLYPGGASYTPGTLAFNTKDITLGPDPKTNPLGIYYSSSNIMLEKNTTLRGTIIDRGDIVISGTNINLQALDLPSIDGGVTPVQLPVMIVGDDVDVEDKTTMTVNGSIATYDRFRFRKCAQTTSLNMTGHMLVGELNVNYPEDWVPYSWEALYLTFKAQSVYEYFPEYLKYVWGSNITPRYYFQPPATPVTLHWMKAGDPLYAPLSASVGLSWQVIDWRDDP